MERTINKVPLILTNDPSMTAWGWVVISLDGTVVDMGCIKTAPENKKKRIRKSDDRLRRIDEIYTALLEITTKYHIKLILSEAPHGSQNASAAVMIGMVAAVIQAFDSILNYPVEWYSEEEAKKAVLGKRSASKQEMIDAIQNLYDIKLPGVKYKDEAIADAVAVFHAAKHHSNIIKML